MINLVWLRRDLRIEDNSAIYHAAKDGLPIQLVFIFDKNILFKLDANDARVNFIHDTLINLNHQLHESYTSGIDIYYGTPEEAFHYFSDQYPIRNVYLSRDYEPYALERDQKIESLLKTKNIGFKTSKDHVIFEHDEVLKDDGTPYTVFTPYKRKWLAKLDTRGKGNESFFFKSYPSAELAKFNQQTNLSTPSLIDLGFKPNDLEIPSHTINQSVIRKYDQQRDFPGIAGTSKLGIHFRFGTISIRQKARKAIELNETYLSELIWRDFYAQILANFPHVVKHPFRAKYDKVAWRFDQAEFQAWCDGRTGYPLVDAGMRELNATGFMHNRVRMVVASFLCKHLLMDWRLGETYFAKHLLDFDLASNNGGWQWAAGCGTDAAPYFRIFNPTSQMKKFDKELTYVKKWVPEYGSDQYPPPIVDHKAARERCLRTYKEALN